MGMPAGARSTVVLAALVGLLALPASAAPDTVDDEYWKLVTRYAHGERAIAIAGLARFSEADLGRIAQAAQAATIAAQRGQGAEPALPLRAAVMLHVDFDEAERPEASGTEQPRRCPGKQVDIAARYARLLAGNERTTGFARRFFVALAHRSQWDACFPEAQRWAREGLKLFPRDPELLLAAGSVLEESATIWTGAPTVVSPAMAPRYRASARDAAAERAERYKEARAFFEDAVAADDGLILARIRLGRVRWRLGENEAAGAALEDAVARSADPQLLYLAHLFLGQVHEDAGRLGQAVDHYRLCLGLDPGAQAAAVALAHALGRAGDAEGARGVLRRALAQGGRRVRRDAYWDYLACQAAHAPERFDALRQESLQ